MRPLRLGAVLACAVAGWACGYALVGRGVTVDPSIKKISVPLFRDATGKPGLDQKVTQKVIEELFKRGRFEVLQESEKADAVVEGEIIGYNVAPVGFGGETLDPNRTQATRYAITLTARVKYFKLGEKEPIWSNDAFSFRDEYDVGNAITFFDREDQSIDRVVAQFARNLVAAMLEAF